jgi:hypothetical protein
MGTDAQRQLVHLMVDRLNEEPMPEQLGKIADRLLATMDVAAEPLAKVITLMGLVRVP